MNFQRFWLHYIKLVEINKVIISIDKNPLVKCNEYLNSGILYKSDTTTPEGYITYTQYISYNTSCTFCDGIDHFAPMRVHLLGNGLCIIYKVGDTCHKQFLLACSLTSIFEFYIGTIHKVLPKDIIGHIIFLAL